VLNTCHDGLQDSIICIRLPCAQVVYDLRRECIRKLIIGGAQAPSPATSLKIRCLRVSPHIALRAGGERTQERVHSKINH